MQKIIYFSQLLKLRLSFSVVFSAVAGYFLGANQLDFKVIIYLILGGFFVVGSANSFNQILEREHDKLMSRTANRPLPKGNLEIIPSLLFSFIIGAIGLILLYIINPYCSYYGLCSIVLYVLLYTPLKRVSPVSLFIGAIPGAIPFLLGWVASFSNSVESGFEMASGILFAIQFFWQFPHFIAISWVQHDDYKKAGFKMMIGSEKGKISIIVSIITSIFLMFFSLSPFIFEIPKLSMSHFGFFTILTLNILFLTRSFQLLKTQEDYSAKRLMFSSFIYLPLLQLSLIIDKYLIIP